MFVWQLSALSVWCVSIVLQFIYIMFSVSMAGMPKKACPYHVTTNNLHIFCLLLCFYYLTYDQLCYCCSVICFNWMFLFLVAANCSFVAFGNNLLYMHKDILFPSLLSKLGLMMFLDLLLLLIICY